MTTNRQLVEQTTLHDELSHISGIGPARRRWLSDTFHINTVGDLAAASADEIYRRLKEEQIISRSNIESWVEQAKTITNSDNLKPNLKVAEQGWKPFASFVVEFQEEVTTGQLQTKAHHVETDKTMKWSGIGQDALCNWVIEQLGNKIQPSTDSRAGLNDNQSMQPKFNERLETILKRLARLTPTQQLPLSTEMHDEENITKSQPTLSSTSISDERGYSDKLKQILAKTQKLTTKVG